MSRNAFYVVIGLLVIAVMILGYMYYQERQKPSGVEIKIGEDGVSIQSN